MQQQNKKQKQKQKQNNMPKKNGCQNIIIKWRSKKYGKYTTKNKIEESGEK